MTTARLETFSDGVFTIAATLLILNVNVTGVPLGKALLHGWPSYVAYAVSFLTIGIMWVNHHGVFSQIDKVDRTLLMINVVFLMFVALVRFPRSSLPRTSIVRARGCRADLRIHPCSDRSSLTTHCGSTQRG